MLRRKCDCNLVHVRSGTQSLLKSLSGGPTSACLSTTKSGQMTHGTNLLKGTMCYFLQNLTLRFVPKDEAYIQNLRKICSAVFFTRN